MKLTIILLSFYGIITTVLLYYTLKALLAYRTKLDEMTELISSGDILANLAKQCEGMAELFSPASTSEAKTEGLAKAKVVKTIDTSYM